jgi:hypothetical protein
MREPFVRLTAFSLDAPHLKVRRCRWAWCPLRIGVAVCIHDAEIVLRVLIQVFGSNPVATGRRLARERDIAFEYLVGVAADLYVGAVAVKSLDPLRQSWAVMVRVVPVVSAARAFVWSWSHDTCLIAVDTVGPLSGGSIPLAALGRFGQVLAAFRYSPQPPSTATLDGTAAYSNHFLPSDRRATGPRDNTARDAGEIFLDPVKGQSGGPHNGTDRVHLVHANFGSKDSIGRQQPRELCRYRPVGPKTVLAAIESPPWVVTGDLARRQPEVSTRDVGRIGDDDVKLRRYCRCPIAYEEKCPIGKTESDCIAGRRPYRILGDVDADAACRRELAEKREQEAACARAEIEKTKGRTPVGVAPENGLDNRLGLRPRIECLGGQGKLKAPELPLSENAAQWLALDHAAQHGSDSADLLLIHRPIGMTEKIGPRDCKSRSNQSAGVPTRFLETGRG